MSAINFDLLGGRIGAKWNREIQHQICQNSQSALAIFGDRINLLRNEAEKL